MHDPAALAAVLESRYFTWRTGQIRVLTEGIGRGMSVMDAGLKRWNGPNAWDGRPCLQACLFFLVCIYRCCTHASLRKRRGR